MQHYLKSFKVAAVSRNMNSFGLKGVIMIAEDGEAYEIAVSYIYRPLVGQVYSARITSSGQLDGIGGVGYELPRKLQDAPPEVVEEVWKLQKKTA